MSAVTKHSTSARREFFCGNPGQTIEALRCQHKKRFRTQSHPEGLNSHCRTVFTFSELVHIYRALQYSEASIEAPAVSAVSDLQAGMRPAVGTSQLRTFLCMIS